MGVVLDDPNAAVSGPVGAVLSDAVDALARAGAAVVRGWPAGVDPAQSSESFGFHVGLFFAFQQPGEQDRPPLAEVIDQEKRRMAVRAAWARYFTDVDVFVCPVNFTAAFPHDGRPFDERVIANPEGMVARRVTGPGWLRPTSWCHTGTMKRMNLRDVPDDVYAALASAAEENRQSLSAFVVERLVEVAQVASVADYVSSFAPPRGTGVTIEDAVAAVREVREAS